MSQLVKLAARLPGDEEINGLDGVQRHFLEDVDQTPMVALVWFTVRETRHNPVTEADTAVVEVRRVEPIGTPTMVPPEIRDLAADLHAKRTGRAPLPITELESPAGDVGNLDDAVVQDGPRLSQDPAQIGEAYVFDSQEA